MASKVILVCVLGALVSCASAILIDIEDAAVHFEIFIRTYNKTYTDESEKLARFQIFIENLHEINRRNNMGELDRHGITKFADLSIEEFKSKYTGHRRNGDEVTSCRKVKVSSIATGIWSPPEELDWRQQNKVSRVKDQQHCGSCWAFSAIANVESQYAMVYNEFKTFSEQQLVDCDYDDCGCCGGLAESALEVLMKQDAGLISDEDYPYKAHRGMCQYENKKNEIAAKVTGCIQLAVDEEEDLKMALFTYGPFSIALDGGPLQTMHNGEVHVCHDADFTVNHAVLLVGYGTSDDGKPYWIIKNSWGENWGDRGFIKLLRNANSCNLMRESPVVAVVE